MGLGSLPALLLGAVPLSRTALAAALLNSTVHTALLNSTVHTTLAKREQDSNVHPTYHTVDTDLLSDAIHCLYQWCDAENKLAKKGGMARCRTPGGYGAEVFICNKGPPQKCSGIQLSKAINEVRMVGSETGAVVHQPDPQTEGLLFGFEYFCKKGHKFCQEDADVYDATRKHCNQDIFKSRILQYDHIADRRRGTGEFSYIGYSWLTEPTSTATQYTYSFKTINPSAAATEDFKAEFMFAEHFERRSVEERVRPQPRAAALPSVADSIPDQLSASPSSGPAPTPTPLAPGDAIQSADLHITKSPSGSSSEIAIPSAASLP